MQSFKERLNENALKHSIIKVSRRGKNKVINTTKFEYNGFEFNGNLISIDIEQEKFSNYVSSYENLYYSNLKSIMIKLKEAQYAFLDEFELDEYEASEYTSASNRLKRILAQNNNIDISKLPKIQKLKPIKSKRRSDKRYAKLRIYVYFNENTKNFELYLIDLYHLGVSTPNIATGKDDLVNNYNSVKDNKKCISKISDEFYE